MPSNLPWVPLPLPGEPNKRIVLIFSMGHVSLVQQLIPIIAAMWLVPEFPDQPPHRLLVDAKRGSGLRHDVFFHHHAAKIVRAILQGNLTYLWPLGHPTGLHVREIIQKDA